MVTMRTLISGYLCLTSFVAARPSMTGILTSMRIRSGLKRGAQQERLPSVGRLANDLHVGLVGERVLEALPGELMVVDYGQAQWPAYVLWRDLGSHLSIHPR